eukprot:scaffold81952_cov61-Phaeocystis_antarctica.AAC.2
MPKGPGVAAASASARISAGKIAQLISNGERIKQFPGVDGSLVQSALFWKLLTSTLRVSRPTVDDCLGLDGHRDVQLQALPGVADEAVGHGHVGRDIKAPKGGNERVEQGGVDRIDEELFSLAARALHPARGSRCKGLYIYINIRTTIEQTSTETTCPAVGIATPASTHARADYEYCVSLPCRLHTSYSSCSFSNQWTGSSFSFGISGVQLGLAGP